MNLDELFRGPPTAAKWQMLGRYLKSQHISGGTGVRVARDAIHGTIISATRQPTYGGEEPGTMPFEPTLNITEAGIEVTFADGYLNERLPSDGAALIAHLPANIHEVHLPTIGDQFSLRVCVLPTGAVGLDGGGGSPVEIAITAVDEASQHYVPPREKDEDEPGSPGTYYYKLAVVRAADDDHPMPWLQHFLAGSHIDHFRELPLIDNINEKADKTGRVFKQYDRALNKYLFRALDVTPGKQLQIEEKEDTLEIRGNKKNASLAINVNGAQQAKLEWDDGLVTSPSSLTANIVTGNNVDGTLEIFDEGDSVTDDDRVSWVNGMMTKQGQSQVLLPVVQAGTGIYVSIAPGKQKTYIVSRAKSGGGPIEPPGTGETGSLLIRDYGETTGQTIAWEDGLVMSKDQTIVELPEVKGGTGITVNKNGRSYEVKIKEEAYTGSTLIEEYPGGQKLYMHCVNGRVMAVNYLPTYP